MPYKRLTKIEHSEKATKIEIRILNNQVISSLLHKSVKEYPILDQSFYFSNVPDNLICFDREIENRRENTSIPLNSHHPVVYCLYY